MQLEKNVTFTILLRNLQKFDKIVSVVITTKEFLINFTFHNYLKMGAFMFFLDQFETFGKICIQCHDGPDADTIGSAYGLYDYFCGRGKEVHVIYSGANRITKPGLQQMIRNLSIPIEYVEKLPDCDVLITADCQYGEGNVTSFPAPQVAMVDHHPGCVEMDKWCCIHSEYGSCCTVVWQLLKEKRYDFDKNEKVATALYYGLYTDTGHLSEIYHPYDKEMRDSLSVNRELLDLMINSNLSRKELQIAGEALVNYYYDDDGRFAIFHALPCDPNLLGVISDLVNQVAGIDSCVVYSESSIGYKLSVRSGSPEVTASELAQAITREIGTGGGHPNKAGGFVLKKMLVEKYNRQDFEKIICERIRCCIAKKKDDRG